MSDEERPRLTPVVEWEMHHFRRFAALDPDDPAAGERWDKLNRRRLGPRRAWWWRWWRPMAALVGSVVVAVVCLVVGIGGPEDEAWPAALAGFGGGVLGSSVVAGVMFLVELRRESIRSTEDRLERRWEREELAEMVERDVNALGELLVEVIDGANVDLAERLDEIAERLRRAEP